MFRTMLAERGHDHDTVSDYLENVEAFYGDLYEIRAELLALWDVPTEGGSLKDKLAALLGQTYREFTKTDQSAHATDFEVHIFTELVLSSIHYLLERGERFSAADVLRAFKNVTATMADIH